MTELKSLCDDIGDDCVAIEVGGAGTQKIRLRS